MGEYRSVYLEKLTEFSAFLRQEGLTVGPGETRDACEILEYFGFEDRELVKNALCAVYAKTQAEQTVFARCFDGFFVSQEQKELLMRRRKEEAEELAKRKDEAQEELKIRGEPMDLREDLRETYVTMPEERREYLRQLLRRSQGNLERNPNLYGNFIRSVFMRTLLEQQMLMEDSGVGCGEADPDLALLYRDISQFGDSDIPKATAMIARISRQIDAELSRRRKRSAHSGKLDFKRTIRKGLETGGAFYRLSFRKKRRIRRRLVLLCDVSGSMLQFSEFALRFIKSMSEVSDASRVFLFSEDIFEVSPFALQNMESFREYVRSSGLYGRGTDLGTSLKKLMEHRPQLLGQSTTLLILSDTKTIDVSGAARQLLEAQRLAGKVLWLNPIPEQKWKYVRSIQTMQMICQMVPCSTLDELARACKKLMQ